MIKSILVVLDDSDSSTSAIKLGAILAKKHKASLSGIGIVDAPWVTIPEAIPIGGAAFKVDLDAKILKEATHRVHTLEQKFVAYCKGEKISASVINTTGIPFEEIEHFSNEFDLILMGKNADFHFTNTEETSAALQRVLKDIPRPVIVTSAKSPQRPRSNVLIAFDGSAAASKALHMAILTGILKGKTLHIASVSENEALARQWANSAAKLCQHHGLTSHLHPIASAQKPSTVLLELIKEIKPSLIVLGAYGQSRIRAFFMGSSTKELLEEVNVPCFVFH